MQALKDAGEKGSQTAFSLKGLLQHAASKPGARHHAYNEALKHSIGGQEAAASGGGGQRQGGSVGVSVKATRGPTADAPSGMVVKPPLVRLGNTETSRSPGGEMGGLNGHAIKQALRDKGYHEVQKAMSTYGRGGCDNHGFVVFNDTDDGLREAATLARDMERAGYGLNDFCRVLF
jgi:hypothetical protein